MYPSYTSVKIVHDQKIQEALEQQHLYAAQKMQKPDRRQWFDKFLAHFSKPAARRINCNENA